MENLFNCQVWKLSDFYAPKIPTALSHKHNMVFHTLYTTEKMPFLQLRFIRYLKPIVGKILGKRHQDDSHVKFKEKKLILISSKDQ